MNYLDIILIIPLLWGLYKGFTKGFILELASLIALGLAVWGGINFSDFLAGYLREKMNWQSKFVPIISFSVIFILILVLVYALAKLIERLVKAVSLGLVNKLSGGIFGVLKFGLIISILIFILNTIESTFGRRLITPDIKQKSLLYEPVEKVAPIIFTGLKESKIGEMLPKIDSVNVKAK